MKLTVIASLLVLLSGELSAGLASTVRHSQDLVSNSDSHSMRSSLTYLPNYQNNLPPHCGDGGSRYGRRKAKCS